MGHYCKVCDEKLVGGVVSNVCDCVECYCQACWDELFEKKDVKVVEKLYKMVEGVEYDEVVYKKVQMETVCSECLIPMEYDGYEEY